MSGGTGSGEMITFEELSSRVAWRVIPNCPGRFVLASGPSLLPPHELVGVAPINVAEYQVAAVADPILVLRFEGGGLISYRKPNGTYVHTLNDAEGLERKLQQLELSERRVMPG